MRLTQPRFDLARTRPHRRQQPAACLRRARHVRRGAQTARAALFAAAPGLARAPHRLGAEARRRAEALRRSDGAARSGGHEARAAGVGARRARASTPCCRRRRRSAPRIHFICGSGEASEDTGGKVVSQPTNDLGRIARALPMFLAEEIYLRTNARTAFLLPWMKQGGFILSAKPWTRAFLPPDHTPPDLIVYLHVDARTVAVVAQGAHRKRAARSPLRWCSSRRSRWKPPGHDALTLLYDLIPRLTILLALRREESNSALGTPPAELLPGYLAAIEQALADRSRRAPGRRRVVPAPGTRDLRSPVRRGAAGRGSCCARACCW